MGLKRYQTVLVWLPLFQDKHGLLTLKRISCEKSAPIKEYDFPTIHEVYHFRPSTGL